MCFKIPTNKKIKIHFFASQGEINVIFMTTKLIFILIYTILKCNRYFAHIITSHLSTHDVSIMMTLHSVFVF